MITGIASLFYNMNKRIECIMLKMSLYVIILLFSFQISAAITSKESEAVSPLLMDVNSSLTIEIFLNIPHHRNHRNRAYFL